MQQPEGRPLSALDVIFGRRSVRAYTPQKIDAATIRALLDAAVQAPTALRAEPWAFVVIQDPVRLRRYSDLAKGTWATGTDYRDLHLPADPATARAFLDQIARPEFCIFYDANTLIVICARPLGPFVAADCWLAAENLMLAASAMGLGTCCIGSAVPVLNSPDIKAELSIPDDVEVIAPIVVGVQSGPGAEVPRRDARILSWM
jgi:nitroreductase